MNNFRGMDITDFEIYYDYLQNHDVLVTVKYSFNFSYGMIKLSAKLS
jgi:hypothetical protein